MVVKAQHRGVASLMKQDMANLRSILSIVARFDKDADFGPNPNPHPQPHPIPHPHFNPNPTPTPTLHLHPSPTPNQDADFGPVVREWTSEVLKELDFRTEAANMAEVRAL